jgi:putative heme-binding domain-containing protein
MQPPDALIGPIRRWRFVACGASRQHAWLFAILLLSLTAAVGAAQQPPADPRLDDPSAVNKMPAIAGWEASRVVGSPEEPQAFRFVPAFPSLRFNNPVLIAWQQDLNRYVVGQLDGKVFTFDPLEPSGAAAPREAALMLDLKQAITDFDPTLTDGVHELYGMAFDPQFADNGYFYVCFVLASKQATGLVDGTRVVRFHIDTQASPPRAEVESQHVILTWLGGGHNGGDLAFDNDGMLLVATGDAAGPSPPDALKTGQRIDDLLGSILRIDVRDSEASQRYRIPSDNPFVDEPRARGEVWAYGLRNPWRMSVDRETSQLWLGDVGWELWELVHRIDRGGNYGWSIREGNESILPDVAPGPTPLLPPQAAIPHTEAASITGGFVYRGSQFPELQGSYLCGDWTTGRLWSLPIVDGNVQSRRELARGLLHIVSFAADANGEPLIAHHAMDTPLYRIERNSDEAKQRALMEQFPKRLSETGLYSDTAWLIPNKGVIAVSINHPQWLDGLLSEHWIATPPGGRMQVYSQPVSFQGWGEGNFTGTTFFPEGTVLVKHILLPENPIQEAELPPINDVAAANASDWAIRIAKYSRRPVLLRRVETQLLHFDGQEWRAYSYLWQEDQTDAVLVPADGTTLTLRYRHPYWNREEDFRYRIHSRTECLTCHNPWAGFALAFRPEQLAAPHKSLNPIEFLRRVAVLEARDGSRASIDLSDLSISGLPSMEETSASAKDRIRAYMDVNCAHCHQFNAGGTVDMTLRWIDQPKEMKVLDVVPAKGEFEIPGAKIIAPGRPHASILAYRMATAGSGRMPHLGSSCVDVRALAAIDSWVASINRRARKEPQPCDEHPVALALEKALGLSRRIVNQQVSEEDQTLIASMAKDSNPLIRNLFEGHLPSDQRAQRLGNSIDAQSLLAQSGDATRGERIFRGQSASNCASCHRIGDEGGAVGPALSDVGTRLSRRQLLESLIDPSRTIDPAYRTFIAVTDDGQTIAGLLIQKDDRTIVLRNARGEDISLQADAVESIEPQSVSLMPDQLLRDLTAQQAADLIEYLSQQRAATPK